MSSLNSQQVHPKVNHGKTKAIYTRKINPSLHERRIGALFKHGLYKMRSARINGSWLIRRETCFRVGCQSNRGLH